MTTELYDKADKFFLAITEILDNYTKSKILQDFFFDVVKSHFYADLIRNFFSNLTPTNITELNIPMEKVNTIKSKYSTLLQEIEIAVSSSFQATNINEQYYDSFKSNLKKDLPEIMKLISELEKKVEIDKAKDYFRKKRKEIEKTGKLKSKLEFIFITKMFENYVQKEKKFPMGDDLAKLSKTESEKVFQNFTQNIIQTMKANISKLLKDQREYQKGFENRLYRRWKEPIDLLELMIRVSTEAGAKKKNSLGKKFGKILDEKGSALLKIHVRSIQISGEILTLIKAGYADGANARWRSLHELAVVSTFLRKNDNEVSKRFLEHDIIKRFKEGMDYQKYHKQLGYESAEKDLELVKLERNKLLQKYGNDFKEEYGWIPSRIIRGRITFRNLEEHVKLDKFRPLYNLSSNAIHGGARGFFSLGVMDSYRNQVLPAGSTNYGLADPIQNTALMLMHVTSNLLLFESDFESIANSFLMMRFCQEIPPIAVGVQKQLEEEEKSKPKDEPPSGFIIK